MGVSTATGVTVQRGSRRGLRRIALLAVLAMVGLLVAGSLVGQDDDFPFGPFRMYSTANAPSGSITSITLEKRLVGSTQWSRVTDGQVGMRRAEYEGQWQAIVAHPSMLGDLIQTYDRRAGDGPGVAEMRLIRTRSKLSDRTVVSRTRQVLATGTAS